MDKVEKRKEIGDKIKELEDIYINSDRSIVDTDSLETYLKNVNEKAKELNELTKEQLRKGKKDNTIRID